MHFWNNPEEKQSLDKLTLFQSWISPVNGLCILDAWYFTSKVAATDRRSPHSSKRALSCGAVRVSWDSNTSILSACYSKTHVLISQQCHGPRGNFSTLNRKPLSHSSTTITSHAHRFPNSPQTWLTLGDRELTDTCRAFSISRADPSASPTACTSTCKHITVTWFFKTQNLEQSIKISSHESPCTEGPLSVSKQSEVVSTQLQEGETECPM
jgi:hypothetical protein